MRKAAIAAVLFSILSQFPSRGAEWQDLNREAISKMRDGNCEEAVELINKALLLSDLKAEDKATLLKNLSVIYKRMGQSEKATAIDKSFEEPAARKPPTVPTMMQRRKSPLDCNYTPVSVPPDYFRKQDEKMRELARQSPTSAPSSTLAPYQSYEGRKTIHHIAYIFNYASRKTVPSVYWSKDFGDRVSDIFDSGASIVELDCGLILKAYLPSQSANWVPGSSVAFRVIQIPYVTLYRETRAQSPGKYVDPDSVTAEILGDLNY